MWWRFIGERLVSERRDLCAHAPNEVPGKPDMQDTSQRAAELAAWLASTDIDLLELRTPHGTLRLGRQGNDIVELPGQEEEADATGEKDEAAETETVAVKASSVGVFLRSHPLATQPLASVGQHVQAGQLMGLLSIGPLLLPVAAPQAGIVDAMHVQGGVAVGYGTALVDLHPL
ncbi:acetyl-CoA carboxylase biotin carboxyl carrier protein subunit [Variovorax sp. RCC_210]|uniref:acetyl-CoA carboxylase biotin carboxyl carrier protein n=1 Tax=Variovorax sp. RCC_210 TaxID=3239217 RepID=UPI00352546B1